MIKGELSPFGETKAKGAYLVYSLASATLFLILIDTVQISRKKRVGARLEEKTFALIPTYAITDEEKK